VPRPRFTASLVFATVFIGLSFPRAALASPPIARLTAALDELDQWVGDKKNGDAWRSYLRSKQLREQLELNEQADPAVVSRALQQYRSGASGLEKKRFVMVRRELQAWLDSLRSKHAGDLAKLAWAARGDHVPLTDESFAVVRNDLQKAANQLENRLGLGSSYTESWKDYLKWSQLEPHFSSEVKITGQSLRELDTVLRRLRANQPGLEHPAFVRTASVLQRYRELALWYALGQRRDTRPRYSNFLLELEKQITRNLEKPTVESARQVGKIVGLMHQLRHSPWLVEQIRAKFNQPNLWVDVSATALQRLAQRPVSETEPVRDCILGARVRGTAHSTGVLGLRTLPAANHIAIELQLAGNIESQTFSYKKPVRVGSLGSTNFTATKHLQINDEQFLVLPAVATAQTKTRTCSIKKTGGRFGRRLVERIARKKVAESKSQAEWIGARHAEQRVADKFDRQVVKAIYQARQNYDSKLHPPLERIGMFPEHLHMASTAGGIQIETRLATYKQISTDRLPPGRHASNDFTLQVHETAFNNFLPHLLAGAKLGQASESQPPKLEGEVPAWLKKLTNSPQVKDQFVSPANAPTPAADQETTAESKASDFKPWSFQLNSEHPVSVSFDDQQVTLRIRIAELKTIEDGEESVLKNWDFLVKYRVVQSGNGILLRREGEIEALPTGFDPAWENRIKPGLVGVRSNLEANINKRAAAGGGFPLEIPFPPIKLPATGAAQQSLQLQQLDCDEGWLTLGYRLP